MASQSRNVKAVAFSMSEADRIVLQSACILRGTSNKSLVMREAIHYYAKRLRQEAESGTGK